MTTSRRLRARAVAKGALIGLATILAAGTLAAEPAHAMSRPVPASTFGMHDPGLTAPAGLGYGAVRLWDTRTTWADLQPSPTRWSFAHLDDLVARARQRGVQITLVLGSGPAWAAAEPRSPHPPWLPPGTASRPKRMADWVRYVRTVATRYQGRIHSYQIWNEGGLSTFWRGTPAQLAALTKAAFVTIRRADPRARVVATGLLPRQPRWTTWSRSYLRELAARGWPVDVFALHSYQPDALAGPEGRVVCIARVTRLLRAARVPRKPLWDTEANYTAKSGAPVTSEAARATWISRAALDSVRLGIDRTFWYGWGYTPPFLLVPLRPFEQHLVTARAYATTAGWLTGSRFRGCSTRRAGRATVTTCAFTRGASSFRVAWTLAGQRARIPSGTRVVCPLLSPCTTPARTAALTAAPALLR